MDIDGEFGEIQTIKGPRKPPRWVELCVSTVGEELRLGRDCGIMWIGKILLLLLDLANLLILILLAVQGSNNDRDSKTSQNLIILLVIVVIYAIVLELITLITMERIFYCLTSNPRIKGRVCAFFILLVPMTLFIV